MTRARIALLAALGGTLLTALTVTATAARAAGTPSVAGTVWRFSADSAVEFQPGGIVRFVWLDCTGRWSQQGEQLRFDCNGFTMYEVVIRGDEMQGHWRRLKGDDMARTVRTGLTRVRERAGPARIAGTRWQFDGTDTTVEFLSDSSVRFSTGQRGRWCRDGDRLTFDKGGAVHFELEVHGDRMTGTLRFVVDDGLGRRFPSSLRRVG